jgi:hypothetical protein
VRQEEKQEEEGKGKKTQHSRISQINSYKPFLAMKLCCLNFPHRFQGKIARISHLIIQFTQSESAGAGLMAEGRWVIDVGTGETVTDEAVVLQVPAAHGVVIEGVAVGEGYFL